MEEEVLKRYEIPVLLTQTSRETSGGGRACTATILAQRIELGTCAHNLAKVAAGEECARCNGQAIVFGPSSCEMGIGCVQTGAKMRGVSGDRSTQQASLRGQCVW